MFNWLRNLFAPKSPLTLLPPHARATADYHAILTGNVPEAPSGLDSDIVDALYLGDPALAETVLQTPTFLDSAYTLCTLADDMAEIASTYPEGSERQALLDLGSMLADRALLLTRKVG